MDRLIISIDAMGGANAPHSVLDAMNSYLTNNHKVFFRVFGDKEYLDAQLSHYHYINDRNTEIHQAEQIIADDVKPKDAFKKYKDSSMYLAVDAVRVGMANACISSGNTGALLFISQMLLRTIEYVKRPALIGVFPNLTGGSVMLDLGANAECDAVNFFQFALMGHCYAQIVLQKKSPSIAILNVGSEETKGREIERMAFQMLKNSGLNFYGFVEGYDIASGAADVVVTDGFSGNLVIKASEGVAKMVRKFVKEGFNSTYLSMIGGSLSKQGLSKAFEKIDPRNHNGGMFIGLNGLVMKSHGSSDAKAFLNAIHKTVDVAERNINENITKLLKELHEIEDSGKPSLVSKIKKKLHIGD